MQTRQLIEHLQQADLFSHPVRYFKVIETHASFVLLTGEYAYKIKKPVDFVFLDYSTLDKRKYFCELELALNQRLAKPIYQAVIPIRGTTTKPSLAKGEIIEYALQLKEFSQADLFSNLAKQHKITANYIEQIAQAIAEFHQQIDTDIDSYIGTAQQVHEPVLQNFDQIFPLEKNPVTIAQLNRLKTFAEEQWQYWQLLMTERKQAGMIKACHGDIHLGNITLFNQKPMIFDCIEFNEAIRWTDVITEIAFLYMDLIDHDLPVFANQFLNRYLQLTGDYQGLALLPYYLNYRAMVRAKINLFQAVHSHDEQEKKITLENYHRFLNLAEKFTKQQIPKLILLHGQSGSGKSSLANYLVEQFGFIQISSDIERKRLAGLPETAQAHLGLMQGYYQPEFTEQVYQTLFHLSKIVVTAGHSVVIDATFAEQYLRKIFIDHYGELNENFRIIHCEAEESIAMQILEKRQHDEQSISEARPDVLTMQKKIWQPLTNTELKYALSCKNYQFEEIGENYLSKL